MISDTVSTITLFFNAIFLQSCISLLVSCLIMRVYHAASGPRPPPVPQWTRRWLLCFWLKKYEAHQVGGAALPSLDELIRDRKYDLPLNTLAPLLPHFVENGAGILSTLAQLEDVLRNQYEEDAEESAVHLIKYEVNIITRYVTLQLRNTKVRNEWTLLGHILDRVYFVVFFFCMMASGSYIIGSSYVVSKRVNMHHLSG